MKVLKVYMMTLALVLMMVLGTTAYAQDDFVGVKSCKVCHNKSADGEQFNKWSATNHAKAFETLGTDAAKEVGAKLGIEDPQKAPECLKCHVTSYDVKTKKPHEKVGLADGISCETCHGPRSGHVDLAKKFKMKKITIEEFLPNPVKPAEKDCIVCHNDSNPTWNPEKYTLDDGTKVGFDFKQAAKKIEHKKPEA